MTTPQHPMSPREFFEYLVGRDETYDLALQLAYVYDHRDRVAERVTAGR